MKPIIKTVTNNKVLEKIEVWKPKKTKGRNKILERQSKAKSFRRWLQSSIVLLEKDKNLLHAVFLKDVLKKYDFYLERDKVVLQMWKGKSGLKIIEKPDCFVVVRHQKIEKGGKPEQKVMEIEKTEVNEMIHAINHLWKKLQKEGTEKEKKKGVPTCEIAEMMYKKSWKEKIYADRNCHHTIVYCLNILEKYKMINYSRAGFTKVLKRANTIQEILKGVSKT